MPAAHSLMPFPDILYLFHDLPCRVINYFLSFFMLPQSLFTDPRYCIQIFQFPFMSDPFGDPEPFETFFDKLFFKSPSSAPCIPASR